MQANQSLLGVFMGTLFERPSVRSSVDDMLKAIATGSLRSVIERTFKLSEVAAAHEYAEKEKPLGRIVITP